MPVGVWGMGQGRAGRGEGAWTTHRRRGRRHARLARRVAASVCPACKRPSVLSSRPGPPLRALLCRLSVLREVAWASAAGSVPSSFTGQVWHCSELQAARGAEGRAQGQACTPEPRMGSAGRRRRCRSRGAVPHACSHAWLPPARRAHGLYAPVCIACDSSVQAGWHRCVCAPAAEVVGRLELGPVGCCQPQAVERGLCRGQ